MTLVMRWEIDIIRVQPRPSGPPATVSNNELALRCSGLNEVTEEVPRHSAIKLIFCREQLIQAIVWWCTLWLLANYQTVPGTLLICSSASDVLLGACGIRQNPTRTSLMSSSPEMSRNVPTACSMKNQALGGSRAFRMSGEQIKNNKEHFLRRQLH